MPRPNTPRKRTRRRNPAVVKVPQQARDQEEPQGPAAAPPPRSPRAAVRAGAPPPRLLDTSEWPRRSLYVMVCVMAVTWVVIRLLTYAFSRSTASLSLYMLFFEPFTLVAAAFVAMPIAKRITRERRYLRLVETAMVGVFVFFVSIFFQAGSGALLQTTGNIISVPASKAVATPCVSNCSTNPTVSASPTAAASPTPSASSRPGASPSPAPAPAVTVRANATSYTILAGVDLIAFGLAPLVFYPVYRRLRFKPRTPPPPRERGGRK